MNHPLKDARIEKGLTLEQAGARIDVGPEGFRKYENGERLPRPEQMEKIRREFGIEPNQFYDYLKDQNTDDGEGARAPP